MKFKFDANQSFQVKAIDSVVDLFQGQGHMDSVGTFALTDMLQPCANRLDLDEAKLLENLQAVQQANNLQADNSLQWIDETIETAAGPADIRFPNFSIEMETGTGKTYVYLRTALELHRRYGYRKFIVVVPSVAVREGVLKTLKITQQHLRELYDNIPYRHTGKKQAAMDNPHDFAVKVAQIIKVKIANQLVDGIQYEKIQAWYEMSEWEAEIESNSDRVINVDKSLYDSVVYESNTEKVFVQKLDKGRDDVKFFVKLPRWFKVRTPVGNYNPDWGIVLEERDKFGDSGPVLYLISETKSTHDSSKRRENENQKIRCGEKHFKGALDVEYRVLTNADEL